MQVLNTMRRQPHIDVVNPLSMTWIYCAVLDDQSTNEQSLRNRVNYLISGYIKNIYKPKCIPSYEVNINHHIHSNITYTKRMTCPIHIIQIPTTNHLPDIWKDKLDSQSHSEESFWNNDEESECSDDGHESNCNNNEENECSDDGHESLQFIIHSYIRTQFQKFSLQYYSGICIECIINRICKSIFKPGWPWFNVDASEEEYYDENEYETSSCIYTNDSNPNELIVVEHEGNHIESSDLNESSSSCHISDDDNDAQLNN